MTKTITVKGIGKVTASPDLVVISMELESRGMTYDLAMETASISIDNLNKALEKAGFDKHSIKTTNFDVRTDYRYETRSNSSRRVFNGYVVEHDLKVEFDFDSAKLSKTLSAISSCKAHPTLSVRFTIKDKSQVSDEMLRAAASNARRKAEVLCDASGKKLGDLIAIDYNWGELSIYSNTRYKMDEEADKMDMCSDIEFEPDDIDIQDTATFVWEII